MSLTLVFRATALRNLARIRGEDKALFTLTRRAIGGAYGPGGAAVITGTAGAVSLVISWQSAW